MSHYNVKPIRLDFKPSQLLVGLLAAAGVGACVILICMPLGLILKAILCLMVLLMTGYHILDKGLQRMPWSCTRLLVDNKGEFLVSTRAGNEQKISVLPSSFVASYLTVLNYRISGKYGQHSVVLLPDHVDAESFRQLRVWLRWARHTSVPTEI